MLLLNGCMRNLWAKGICKNGWEMFTVGIIYICTRAHACPQVRYETPLPLTFGQLCDTFWLLSKTSTMFRYCPEWHRFGDLGWWCWQFNRGDKTPTPYCAPTFGPPMVTYRVCCWHFYRQPQQQIKSTPRGLGRAGRKLRACAGLRVMCARDLMGFFPLRGELFYQRKKFWIFGKLRSTFATAILPSNFNFHLRWTNQFNLLRSSTL